MNQNSRVTTARSFGRSFGHRGLWVWSGYGLAGLAGGLLCYDFGQQLAGLWLGLVMGLNGALFCALLAGVAAERLFGEAPPAGQDQER